MNKLIDFIKSLRDAIKNPKKYGENYEKESLIAFLNFLDKINKILLYLFIFVSFICIGFFICEMCFGI